MRLKLNHTAFVLCLVIFSSCAPERTWQETTFDGICYLGNAVWANNQFGAVGYSKDYLGNNVYYFFSSLDGLTWSKQQLSIPIEGHLQWLNGQYVTVHLNDQKTFDVIKYSSDGLNWAEVNLSSIGSIGTLSWNGDMYFTVGRSSNTAMYPDIIFTSLDLVNWQPHVEYGDIHPYGINYVNSLYLGNAYDLDKRNVIARSNDGFSWEKISIVHDNKKSYEFFFAENKYIAFSSSEIFSSDNAIDWHLKSLFGFDNVLNDLAHGNDDYVAAVVNWQNHAMEIWSSLDLVSWRQYVYSKPLDLFTLWGNPDGEWEFTSVVHNGSVYVVTGYINYRKGCTGVILTSP